MYSLKEASKNDLNTLISFKLKTIFESDTNNTINDDEKPRIINYVNNNTLKHLSDYKLITVDNITIGAFLVYGYENGVLIDEIYLVEEYRNKGIGTDILKNIITNYNLIYLWVYKTNTKAIKLYKTLGFKILEETDTRYKMILKK